MKDLSKREQDVLRCIIKGLTNQEIARELLITISTVKIHISSIKDKLGAVSRTSVLYIAIKNNLVDINEI